LNKKILIIGSNGYLGKKLKRDLKHHFNIIEFNKRSNNRDIRNKDDVKEFFLKNNDVDIILNLTGQISNKLLKTKTTNIFGSKNIIKYSNKDSLLIFFSSILLKKNISNLNKDRKNYIDSKIRMEKLIKNSSRNFCIIRLGNVYDNKLDKKGLLKELKKHFFNSKKIKLNNLKEINYYIHYKDFLNYLINKIFRKKFKNKIFSLYTEKFSNIELFNLFRSLKENNINKVNLKNNKIFRKNLFKAKFNILNTIKKFQ
tara:strand:- start:33 stop:800 length:768 start_codon:yes stop_codon:yes gene_type:complete